MDSAKKQEFTMRMTQSNRTELLVVIYDLFLEYMKEAKEYGQQNDTQSFRQAVANGQPVLAELISCLDFQYEISYQLLEIYRYCGSCLATALSKNDFTELEGAILSITNIRKAYYEISLKDESAPLMQNSQKVYAGLTYGKNNLNEVSNESGNRGFLA